ncbi:MAG: DUF2062 domain-containing protein [Myxococcales bacterium]|nr:DUF2062 domain-containing protein [Myxococcales bacterium]
MRALLRRAWARLKALWQRAKNERAAPHQIGWAVGVGVFASCTPAVGFHGPLALGLATVFKLNRLWAWIGSRLSNVITLPLVVYAEVQFAHRVRTGEWLGLDRSQVVEQGKELLVDWLLGMVPVGAVLSATLGFTAYAFFAWRARRAARRLDAGEKLSDSEGEGTIPTSTHNPADRTS